MTGPLHIERKGNLAVVRMDDGKANALGTPMLLALERAADDVKDADAVALLGRPKVFCGGLDLAEVVPLETAPLQQFLGVFHRAMMAWLALPRPVVAGVSGSAVAGGYVLMMAADTRVSADDSGVVGANEVRLGIPFPSVALELIRCGLDPTQAHRALLFGDLLPKRTAHGRGWFHDLVATDLLEEHTLKTAAEVAAYAGPAAAAVKAELRREFVQRAEADRDRTLEMFVRAWRGPLAQERLRAVLAGLASRSSRPRP